MDSFASRIIKSVHGLNIAQHREPPNANTGKEKSGK